jgi:hypothetical protein
LTNNRIIIQYTYQRSNLSYESIKIYAIATIVNPLTIISYILFVEMNVSFLNNLEYLRIFKEQIVKD